MHTNSYTGPGLMRAYGSNGESALIKALELEFPLAAGFLYQTHVVRNNEHKIKSDLHLLDSFYATVVRHVFAGFSTNGNASGKSVFPTGKPSS